MNTQYMNYWTCFVPKVKAGKQLDVPEVDLGEQRVNDCNDINAVNHQYTVIQSVSHSHVIMKGSSVLHQELSN